MVEYDQNKTRLAIIFWSSLGALNLWLAIIDPAESLWPVGNFIVAAYSFAIMSVDIGREIKYG